MNHSRNIFKWGAAAVAATALILGSLSAPAQAKSDDSDARIIVDMKKARDTGWGEV